MKYQKLMSLIALGALLIVPAQSFAQEEPGAAVAVAASAASNVEKEAAISVDVKQSVKMDVDKMVKDFLEEKGWEEGENIVDGKTIFVIRGMADIGQTDRRAKNYIAARQNAYTKAMFEAKRSLVQYISTKLSSEMTVQSKSDQGAGDMSQDDLEDVPDTSMWGKAKTLVHKKLDKELAKEGVDLEAQKNEAEAHNAQVAADKILRSDKFQETMKSTAEQLVTGIQAYKVFVYEPSNGQGSVGVVAIWSPDLVEMASAMTYGKSLPKLAPKTSIKEQLKKFSDTMLYQFGVRKMIDENGDVVLVSFYQTIVDGTNFRAKKDAQRRAKLAAETQIARLAGEVVTVSETLNNAEESADYESGKSIYANESTYEVFAKSVSKVQEINGLKSVASVEGVYTDQVTGRDVYVSVMTWNGTQARKAKLLGTKMKPSRPTSTDNHPTDSQIHVSGDTYSSSSGEGEI